MIITKCSKGRNELKIVNVRESKFNEFLFRSIEISRLKESATDAEIVEKLSHPIHGVEFLSKYPSLPSYTFISYDAVQWMKNRVEGINSEMEAVNRLEVTITCRFSILIVMEF